MTKARRMMEENIKLIDLVIELVDARAPLASRNPDIDRLAANKSRLILLNKADLADQAVNTRWKDHFDEKGYFTVVLDSRKRDLMGEIRKKTAEACREKKERDLKTRQSHGMRYPECRQIDLHQFLFKKRRGKDRQQARSHKRETVDKAR